MTISSSHSRWLRIWIEGLTTIGGIASILALRTHILLKTGSDSAASFCHISEKFDCEAVIGSEWSIFFGVPLASYGIIFYFGLFFIALLTGEKRLISYQTSGRIFFLAGLVSSLASIELFIVSEVVVGSLCLMCITMYLVNFLIFLRSWNLGEPEPIADRIFLATKSLLRSPGLLFGVDASSVWNSIAAWLALLVGAPVSYILMFPPVHILVPQQVAPPTNRITIKSTLDGTAFGDYFKGPLDARVEIVEFADFECPACRQLHVFMDEFLKEFEGKYRFVFRNFPLDNKCNPEIGREFHKYACSAATYARCAGEQGRFWEASDYLFTAPELEKHESSLDVEAILIENGSKTLGLDRTALETCISSNRYLSKLRGDISEGISAGLQYTPSIWINGRLVEKVTAENLRTILAEEIARTRT